mmetsp:Transcript_131400/g.319323  ORF Transcript_131400/g.319323 Transcript_131400/m.319323 type:complete len:219 (+) Transcript_131400:3-659(+)
MIRHMIEQKTSDLTDSVGRKEFCDSELTKAKSQMKSLTLRLEKQTADRDKLEAELGALADSTAELRAEAAEARKAAEDDAEVRRRENAAYMEEKRRYERAAPAPGDRDAASAARLAAETEEAGRDLAFRRRQREARELAEARAREAGSGEAAARRGRLELAEAETDKRDLEEQVANTKEYLAQIERQCIVHPEPFEERKRRRTASIASLKDAYAILGG